MSQGIGAELVVAHTTGGKFTGIMRERISIGVSAICLRHFDGGRVVDLKLAIYTSKDDRHALTITQRCSRPPAIGQLTQAIADRAAILVMASTAAFRFCSSWAFLPTYKTIAAPPIVPVAANRPV